MSLIQYADFQKAIKRLNAEETLETRSQPFFFIFWVIVALFVFEAVYDGYKSSKDHEAMSQMVAACANGSVVSFGKDAVMRCKVSQMVASNE